MHQNTQPIRSSTPCQELAHGQRTLSFSPAPGYSNNTLHCTKYVPGETVQFNGSVSAMPAQHWENSHAPVPGTADTLL